MNNVTTKTRNAAQAHQRLVVPAIIFSAVSFSFIPVIIHFTGHNSNPFYFNGFVLIVTTIIIVLALVVTKPRWIDSLPPPPPEEVNAQYREL